MTAKIDRNALVIRNNPTLTSIDVTSPLSVGNGEIAFTVDVTGMQTLYSHYQEHHMPLCTLSVWGWHTTPVSKERYAYSRSDVHKTAYRHINRKVFYPTEKTEGNEEVYEWLRQNPHRQDLIRVGLIELFPEEMAGDEPRYAEIDKERIKGIRQTLHMENGIIDSKFSIDQIPFRVETCCAGSEDAFAFGIYSKGIKAKRFGVLLSFPYGSSDISGAAWDKDDAYTTEYDPEHKTFSCYLDLDSYYVTYSGDAKVVQVAPHTFLLLPGYGEKEEELTFSLTFNEMVAVEHPANYFSVIRKSASYWKDFWDKTGVIDFSDCTDERARKLERRVVRSQYLLAVNSAGSLPPQETGLTCNSWYGKAHLEMYFWQEAWLPLFGRADLLEKSISWFRRKLSAARKNAERNGFRGARWPKMTGPGAVDAPSPVGPLLIWQQPHILYLLELVYRCRCSEQKDSEAFLRDNYLLVKETADFMADYANKDSKGLYQLSAPLIPVQECHKPEETKNPAFEVEYWSFGMRIAMEWNKRLNMEIPALWSDVAEQMIPAPLSDGLYIAHSAAPDTFDKYAFDHPSMLMTYGMIRTDRIDPELMENTLNKVLECWDEDSLWGWDYGMMAMCAALLGKSDLAVDLLLKDSPNNRYVLSGNNRQGTREELPLYLPGNGALLLCMALMCAGCDSTGESHPGFPEDGRWNVRFEGIGRLPY